MSFLEVDAVPRYPQEVNNAQLLQQRFNSELLQLDSLLDKLSVEDFKSLFFLLLKNCIEYEDYLRIVKGDKLFLKQKFLEMCENFDEYLLIELFGTIKNFEILDKLGTCQHVFENKMNEFCKIKKFWKFLYCICEEIEDIEVDNLKRKLLQDVCDEEFTSAEEVLCFALMKKVFHEANLGKLKEAVQHKQNCLLLIEKFIEELTQSNHYYIRTPTQASCCGIAVIINLEEFYKENDNSPTLHKREGSHVDEENLVRLWKKFGFKTLVYNESLTDVDILNLFKALASLDHSKYDAFITCYLSHGHKDVVYSSNGKEIPIRLLVDIMANKCATLIGKPKVFFIQACQGDEILKGLRTYSDLPIVSKTNLQTDSPGIHNSSRQSSCDIPAFCDVMTVVSTFPGFLSFRSHSEGSWFISSLVKAMECSGDTATMHSIILKVTKEVAEKRGAISELHKNCKQMVHYDSTLRYELQFKKIQS